MAYADAADTADEVPATNRRRRRNLFNEEESTAIATRVLDFYIKEVSNRSDETNRRLQRYAKYRLWTSGTDWPWPDASDIAVPDILQDCLRVQDTLVNAVMSQRPPVTSKANQPQDEKKQAKVDRLIAHQVFNENPGEKLIGDMAESFTTDPVCTVFIPWVRERRTVSDVMIYPEIPEGIKPRDYFFKIVQTKYPAAQRYDEKASGWEWDVTLDKNKTKNVCFYTTDVDEVEMVTTSKEITFDGPCPMVKDYDDVIFPGRSANLQMPGPSNPNGAPFVILRDTPTIDEIKKLKESGFYEISDGDIAAMENTSGSPAATNDEDKQQKDRLQGLNETPTKSKDKAHNRVTRLTCFDIYDDKDMIFWVIVETKKLIKARLLVDMYPANPPRRPFVGESFLTVKGRYSGMSMPEIMEAMHDVMKVLVDQILNGHDLSIAQPGFYRPAGGMNPERLTIEPFSLIPLQNPQQDIIFPPIGNPQASGLGLNLVTMLGQWQDKLTLVTDQSFGMVPPGASSALRTIGGMSLLQGQGEARPERLLRRFFSILVAMWEQIHELNKSFLPKQKEFRIAGVSLPGESPYEKINGAEEISGSFLFDFDANVLNTSKAALQQSLEKLMGTLINPLMIQLGVVTPDGIFRLMQDYGRAQGQNIDAYIHPPTPASALPQISAEEAILDIINGLLPHGTPLEPGGPEEHLQKITAYMSGPEIGLLTPASLQLMKAWIAQVQTLLAQQQQAAMLQQNAASFAQGRQPGGKPGAPVTQPPPDTNLPQVSGPNEMMDETMPTAGGGANAQP